MIIDIDPYQWWEEEDFVFEGIPATTYLWPRDRLILFYNESDDQIIESSVIIPTFHIDTVDGDLRGQIRDAIKSAHGFTDMHVHVIQVDGLLEYGILVADKKLKPVTDCWADSEARKNRMLDRRLERKLSHD